MNSILCFWTWDGRKWNLHDHYRVDEKGHPLKEAKVHLLDWNENNTAITMWDFKKGISLLSIKLPQNSFLCVENVENIIKDNKWHFYIIGGLDIWTKTCELAHSLIH